MTQAKQPETSTVRELMDEVAQLKAINAILMGDDEDKPRYTTKRLRREVAEATATLTARNAELMDDNARLKAELSVEIMQRETWQKMEIAATARIERLEAERDLLREAVDRYGNKARMAWCSRPELQQVIDDAIAARRELKASHE